MLLTGADDMMLPLMLSGFMSEVCIASGDIPWYSCLEDIISVPQLESRVEWIKGTWMRGSKTSAKSL